MNKEDIKQYQDTCSQLLQQQTFFSEELDYSILERHKPVLQRLADLGNSIVSVFDMCKQEHAFYSFNIGSVLGYNSEEIEKLGNAFIDNKIHPDDHLELLYNSLRTIKLLMNLSEEDKMRYKLISEYRILNSTNQYVRVIEQQQVLELDKYGNIWFALSVLDISPNQDLTAENRCQLLNYHTGKFISLSNKLEKADVALSPREIEILKLVKNGLLSKEISDKLFISINTVNTHRQRILEKLEVNNSMEAVVTASKLGLI